MYLISFSDSDIMKETLCEPCSTENLRIQATNFCKTCEDPEALCDNCAKQHTKQKYCKNHEMCKDMEKFRNREPTLWYFIILYIIYFLSTIVKNFTQLFSYLRVTFKLRRNLQKMDSCTIHFTENIGC